MMTNISKVELSDCFISKISKNNDIITLYFKNGFYVIDSSTNQYKKTSNSKVLFYGDFSEEIDFIAVKMKKRTQELERYEAKEISLSQLIKTINSGYIMEILDDYYSLNGCLLRCALKGKRIKYILYFRIVCNRIDFKYSI